MMTAIPPSDSLPDGADEQNLKAAARMVEELLETQRRANRLTLAFGLVSLLALCIYFTIVHRRLSEYLEPQAVVGIAEHLLDAQLPDARESLESKLRESAPAWAAMVSERAQDAIPELRAKIEELALERADQVAEGAIDLTEEQLRAYVGKHRPELEEALRDLAKSPEGAEERLEQLRKRFEDEFDADFQAQSGEALDGLKRMNEKLALLRAGRDLSSEQELERRILMLARRLQLDHLNHSSADASDVEAKVASLPN